LRLTLVAHGELLHQLYDRDQELQRLKALELTDSATEADLMKTLRSLNDEIAAYASAMASTFKFGERLEESATALDVIGHNLNQWIGKTLIDVLRNRTGQDPDLMVLAFRAFFAEYARWIAAGWCFDNAQDEHFLAMYSEMLEKGEHIYSTIGIAGD
jgi:uncharacterized protein YihD (DUF1040 family)